ncbi:hypothetical protein BDW02DRAFT_372573 [Decorospora gaudefroyi]|uniref:Secreted protein n=1 Tax=Decorospora gaudefroyi TaxID=184978 RepID=A0A6A5KB50_9PLEO|nr:hypothetical protein BDW02DRAFT_372573 [Decorospora gaudefroyi]
MHTGRSAGQARQMCVLITLMTTLSLTNNSGRIGLYMQRAYRHTENTGCSHRRGVDRDYLRMTRNKDVWTMVISRGHSICPAFLLCAAVNIHTAHLHIAHHCPGDASK